MAKSVAKFKICNQFSQHLEKLVLENQLQSKFQDFVTDFFEVQEL